MDKTAILLNSLKTILASPALRRTDDKTLSEAMQQADTVLACLLARQVEMPGMCDEARVAYLQVLPLLQKVCAGDAAGTAALSKLQTVLNSSPPASLEGTYAAAVDVLDALYAIDSPQAMNLCKQLVDIESRYSDRFMSALLTAKTPEVGAGSASAHYVKAYDENALHRFIVSQFPQEQDLRIEKSGFLSGGSSKYTMGIELSGNRELPSTVILRADSGAMFGGSSVVEEYRLLKILAQHEARVARPIAIEPTGDVFGSPFMLVEKLPGCSVGHMFNLPQPNLTTCRDAATQLAKIHRIPAETFGSATAGAACTTQEFVSAWIDQSYASWSALNAPEAIMETSFRWLRANVHRYTGRRALVHGDYGLNNLLIDNDKVSCILDWEFAHIGNPVYDLGYFRFQAEALGAWDEFLRAYEEAGGTLPDETQLDYANLLAETRLTVMVRQVEAGYYMGVPQGIPGAINAAVGNRYISDKRISALLDRVM